MRTIKTYRKVGAFYIAWEADFSTVIRQETDEALICWVKFPAGKWRDASIRACIDASLTKSAPGVEGAEMVFQREIVLGTTLTRCTPSGQCCQCQL
jgi:hypothetical protein